MKVIYNALSLIAIILLNSCAQGDKKVDATPTTDGPNVIIDSGNIGGGGLPDPNNTLPINGGGPLNPNAPAVNSNQSLVVPQQGKTAQVSSQNIQMTPAQMQQIQQQAIQNQQIQQPQQAVVSQTAAHPQFSDLEFKKMQDDAQKRGVQLNPVHGQPGHRRPVRPHHHFRRHSRSCRFRGPARGPARGRRGALCRQEQRWHRSAGRAGFRAPVGDRSRRDPAVLRT